MFAFRPPLAYTHSIESVTENNVSLTIALQALRWPETRGPLESRQLSDGGLFGWLPEGMRRVHDLVN